MKSLKYTIPLLVIISIAGMFGPMVVTPILAARSGRNRAIRDIQKGEPAYCIFGIQRRWSMDAAEELKTKYGLKVTMMDADDAGDGFTFWENYNRQVETHFTEKYGLNVIRAIIYKHYESRRQKPLHNQKSAENRNDAAIEVQEGP